jgi:hypothetical protein
MSRPFHCPRPATCIKPEIRPLTWFGKRRLHLRWYRKQVERSRQRFEELVARVKKLAEEVEEPKSEIAEADPGGPAS